MPTLEELIAQVEDQDRDIWALQAHIQHMKSVVGDAISKMHAGTDEGLSKEQVAELIEILKLANI